MKTNNVIKNILGTSKRGGKNDWDGDGVTNKKDCQPRNTMRQDARGWRTPGALPDLIETQLKSGPKTYTINKEHKC